MKTQTDDTVKLKLLPPENSCIGSVDWPEGRDIDVFSKLVN